MLRGPVCDLSRSRCCAGSSGAVTEIQGGRLRVIFGAFGVRIEAGHSLFIDRVLELLQRGDRTRVEIKAVEEHGLILRKKVRVIFEHNKIVLSDLCVG